MQEGLVIQSLERSVVVMIDLFNNSWIGEENNFFRFARLLICIISDAFKIGILVIFNMTSLF